MKLFISDLDGTLLNSGMALSGYTVETVNRLIASGMQFSIATARSFVSAGRVIRPLNLQLPVIVHNGVFICDPATGKNMSAHLTDPADAAAALEVLSGYGIYPLVYTVNKEGAYKVYYNEIQNRGQEEYIQDRVDKGDKRFTKTADLRGAVEEDVITLVAIDSEEKLKPAYERLQSRSGLGFNFSEDIYTHFHWLEITHCKANKKDAVLELKALLRADGLVTFGDNLNDIPMFQVSSLSCAVENAYDEVRKSASRIIACNNEDGVAKFLEGCFAGKSL